MSRAATLDPARNCCPENPSHIHIIGICGTGMAALAGMLKQEGYRITGSDQNVYPPMSDFLAECGIPVLAGYCAENLRDTPDLVIVGNVVRATNPEAIALAEQQIPYLSMPQALAEFFWPGIDHWLLPVPTAKQPLRHCWRLPCIALAVPQDL